MRSTQQNPANAHEELAHIQREFTRLQKRIEAVRDSVADTLVRLFGEQRPAFTGLDEEALIERIAGRADCWPSGNPAWQHTKPPSKRGAAVRPRKGCSGIPWHKRLHAPSLEEQGVVWASFHQGWQYGDVLRHGVGAVHGTANC